MLGKREILATVAVRDLARARKFYEEVLELEPVATEGEEAVTYRTGASHLLVYRSEYAGKNEATAATWMVGDRVDELAGALAARGVPFQRYKDLPGARLEGDVHVFGTLRNAWFKDPDGNILALVSGELAKEPAAR